METKIVDENVESYIRALLPGQENFLQELEAYTVEHYVPIVQPEVAQYLKVMLQILKPKRVLEIGTAIGYSGSLMGIEMGDGVIDTLEINEDMARMAKETFDKLRASGLTRTEYHIHLGDARESLKALTGPYDLIFIDAAKGHYDAYLELALPMLAERGVIISDNVLFKGMVAYDAYVERRKRTIVKRMRHYLDYISHHPMLTTSVLSMGDGVAISYLKENKA